MIRGQMSHRIGSLNGNGSVTAISHATPRIADALRLIGRSSASANTPRQISDVVEVYQYTPVISIGPRSRWRLSTPVSPPLILRLLPGLLALPVSRPVSSLRRRLRRRLISFRQFDYATPLPLGHHFCRRRLTVNILNGHTGAFSLGCKAFSFA